MDLRVRAYLDMVTEQHPPDILLAPLIAPAGDELVQAMWRALQSEGDEARFSYGILLLCDIQHLGYANVRAQAALIEFLERRVEAMAGCVIKTRSADLLDELRSSPAPAR